MNSNEEADASLMASDPRLLYSDSGFSTGLPFSLNWMGLAIGLILLLLFVQMAMPGIRQVGDFMAAVYAPYGGDDFLANRYDTYYGEDYDEVKRYGKQYRNFDETKNLLSSIVNNGQDASPLLDQAFKNSYLHTASEHLQSGSSPLIN